MVEREFLRLVGCGCQSRFCPRCAIGKGLWLRQRVVWIVEKLFTQVKLVTLTIDPKNFASPEAAHKYCKEQIGAFVQSLSRMGHLCSGLYFCAWEPHENGWPHYHLLMDAKFIPIEDLRRAWNARRPKNAVTDCLGIVDIRKTARNLTRKQAAEYVTEYVIKTPRGGWPEWVLNWRGRLHRYSRSNGFFAELVAAGADAVEFDVAKLEREIKSRLEQAKKREVERTTIGQRIARCGGRTIVQQVREYIHRDGEVVQQHRFVAMFASAFDDVCRMLGFLADDGARHLEMELDAVNPEVLRGLCDWRKLKKLRQQQKLEVKLRPNRPVRQQDFGEEWNPLRLRVVGVT